MKKVSLEKSPDSGMKRAKNYITVYAVGAIVITLLMQILGLKLGVYDVMTGSTGLENVIKAAVFNDINAAWISVPLLIYGLHTLVRIIIKRKETDSPAFWFFAVLFLTLTLPFILFDSFTRTHFNEWQLITNNYGDYGDFSLLAACLKDMKTDEYEEFFANNLYFDMTQNISMTGEGGPVYHMEYTVHGYLDEVRGDVPCSWELFKAQIGKRDAEELKNIWRYGVGVNFTVYKNSRFIRSFEPEFDVTPYEGYTYLYRISGNADRISYEKNLSADAKYLMWCGFAAGESDNIENAVFKINADENYIDDPYERGLRLPEIFIEAMQGEREMTDEIRDMPLEKIPIDEICLYGKIDGKYEKVSVSLKKDELS